MISRSLTVALSALLVVGCASPYPFWETTFAELAEIGQGSGDSAYEQTASATAERHLAGSTETVVVDERSGNEAGRRVAASARSFVGKTRLEVDGVRFNYDCSGTILAIYYHAGIDLLPEFRLQAGNGVRRLHGIAADHQLLYKAMLPKPGDVIFWDNTYDRNSDGRFNDELTHAGIVVSVTESGQVEYVHHNYSRGIVVERMNLLSPDTHTDSTVLVNSPMRQRSDRHIRPTAWLASHLYRESGKLHQL